MTLDFSRCRLPPYQHQREDVPWLMARPYALIASQMRTGKTKIVIDAAQFLFQAGTITRLIIVTPAPVRDTWFDPEFGELAKHLWEGLPVTVTKFHERTRTWSRPGDGRPLEIFVTNFEFLRRQARLTQFLPAATAQTLLVGDESSALKNATARQTKAFLQLRRRCGRVVLLNGTPIYHTPLDLYSHGNLLSPKILDCSSIMLFKARYAQEVPVLTHGGRPLLDPYGRRILKIAGWHHLDDLERRFAPITVRRLQADCPDMPVKLDPQILTVPLTPASWRQYVAMRDELVVWLSHSTVSLAVSAAVCVLRLSQITGGFLGGAEQAHAGPGAVPRFLVDAGGAVEDRAGDGPAVVGREKLDALLWCIEQQLDADPTVHLVVWSRFRAEAQRVIQEVQTRWPQMRTGLIMGGQSEADRRDALALLHPTTSPQDVPVCVAGIVGTGSFGINMTAASVCVTVSSGYSPGQYAQTMDRVYGPGQTKPITYVEILATGPAGQQTIDHDIRRARQTGEDLAQRTAAAWVRALTSDPEGADRPTGRPAGQGRSVVAPAAPVRSR